MDIKEKLLGLVHMAPSTPVTGDINVISIDV